VNGGAPIPYSRITAKSADEEIGPVQGIMPGSINEWYTALALDKLEIPYSFQFPLDGGRGLRGGQVIDFVAWTALGGIPIFVQGAYWHDIRHDPEGILKQEAARQYFNNDSVLLMEEETDTKDKAYQAVRTKVVV